MAKNLSRTHAIQAWIKGEPVQVWGRVSEGWIDVAPLSLVLDQKAAMPSFDPSVSYRILPKPVEFTLYVYVNEQGQRIVLDYEMTKTTYKLVLTQKLSYTPE